MASPPRPRVSPFAGSDPVRASLRHMAGYTELLQRKASSVVDEKSNHYMAMVLESAKRMGNLIDDLLAFSRIGRAETQKTLVSLEQLVREALTEVRQDTEGRNIVWKIGALPPAAVKKGIHHVPAHSHLLRM
jgi:light-regulated signal transduction histidine kinase (bacteriophytochrome)